MISLPFRHELMNGIGEPELIDFRAATPDDIDAVMQLQQEIVDSLPDKDLYAASTREEYLTQLKEDMCFIAECNGKTAGFSVLVPNDPDNPYSYRNFLVLNFEIIETRKMYGGKERYILRKEF